MAAIQTRAMTATYKTEVDSWKSIPNEDALKLKVSFIAPINAPPSRPLISAFMLSAMPVSRTFLIMDVMWLAGNRLQTDWTLLENCDSGIYAPITKPDAAVKIPKNAVHVEEFLNKRTTTINKAVEDTEPSSTMP